MVTIGGPTAVGKTPLAVALARRLGSAELVIADSRQVLRGLRIGTCAPTAAEVGDVRCHLIDWAEPSQQHTVAEWAGAARTALAEIGDRGAMAIVVGGTGLYLDTLLQGWTLAGVSGDPVARARREAVAALPDGLARLGAELRRRDPEGATTIELANPRRVVRALEILDATGGSLRTSRDHGSPVAAVRLLLDCSPELHGRLIVQRAQRLFDGEALLDETRAALGRGLSVEALEGAGIGYREALAVLAGTLDRAAAVAEVVRRTRRYAKAQRTWFRRDHQAHRLARTEDALEGVVEAALRIIGAEERGADSDADHATGPVTVVALCGSMGAGKTTVGHALASRLGWQYRDNDEALRQRLGADPDQVVRRMGAAELHRHEAELLISNLERPGPAVVAVPGSATDDPGLRRRLARGWTVFLRARPQTLAARVGSADGRPFLRPDPLMALRRLDATRRSQYEEVSRLVVDVDELRVEEIVERIVGRLSETRSV